MSQKDKYIMSNELKAPKQVVLLSLNTSTNPWPTFPGMSHDQGHLKVTRIQGRAIHAPRAYVTVARARVSGAASHTHQCGMLIRKHNKTSNKAEKLLRHLSICHACQ